jgi:tripartite-type tricarboxylate transporter receptor subunit TctC
MKALGTMLIGCALAAGTAVPASAQDYPNHQVTFVVPFAPGGGTDILGRLVGQKLTDRFGKPFVVENRPGAGTATAAAQVAKAAPDGHTIMMATSGTMVHNAIIHKKLPYDPPKDLKLAALVSHVPFVLVVNNDLPVKSVADLLKLAKERKLSYGSGGAGAFHHLLGELFKSQFGIPMTHVPYRGTLPALNDVIAGQVPILWDTAASSMAHIQSGNLRAIVVAAKTRLPQLPDVPTFAEMGLPDYDAEMWNGLLAPAGLPKDVLAKLSDASRKALADPDVQAKYAGVGAYVVADTPDEFAAMIKADVAKWKKVADFAHISVQ